MPRVKNSPNPLYVHEPKVYPVDEHQITTDLIDPNASYVILKLLQAGYKAYLVGGGVRDLLLKKTAQRFRHFHLG